MNNELLSFDPQSIKEIILEHFDPSIYDQKLYPDIQYYSTSKIEDFNSFAFKFNSSKENEKKYSLINILINKDEDLTKNIINMKNLKNINKISNLLLNIYSFKISREEGKTKLLKDELTNIVEVYNEINPTKIKEEEFINNYINPFIKSWDEIKKKAVQYNCRILRDLSAGESPLEMKIENPLCFFLVDDGDKDGGMFLAAAYQQLIEWQNSFIDLIIAKNNMNGILNSYVSQLEQEIFIQDSTEEEIINIDENTYKAFKDLIFSCSMRDIFEEKKINYRNYNNITYNFDYIEEELGKLILPGKKKFNKTQIKFINYLFEGFRGGNSTVLVDYNNQYIQRELSNDEKESLNELLKENNNSKFYNDIFASLQILMNEIIKENYNQNYLIYKIIESLPNYIRLNEKLVLFFKNKYEYYSEEKVFTINSLVSIFEYFESLCWKEIKKNILDDYKLELSEEIKNFIRDYFENYKNEEKLINKKDFTYALRKLISRSLAGSRQDIDIKSDSKLKLYINRYDLWNKEIINKESFEGEIDEICKDEILIGQSLMLYNLLEGDNILNKEIYKNTEKEIKGKQENINNEINTNQNQEEEKEKEKDNDKEDNENGEQNEEDDGAEDMDDF